MTVATTEQWEPPIRTNPGEGYTQREAGDVSRIQTGTHAIGGAPTTGGSLVILDPEAPSTTLRAALPHPDVNNGRGQRSGGFRGSLETGPKPTDIPIADHWIVKNVPIE